MLLFDIVIPTYNNLEELRSCLKSFEGQTISDFKVWVTVDGSIDGTVEYLNKKQFGFPVTCLQHSDKKNHGRGIGLNLSLPHLSAKYVLFLDSDFTVKSDFLEKHLFVLNSGDCISLGKIIYEKGSVWGDYDQTRGMNQFKDEFAEIPFRYMVTANTALPADIFVKVNGFDENITAYGGEDIELAYNIWEKFKLKVIGNKQAVAFGMMNKPLETALQQREQFAGKNLKYLLQKHPWATDIFKINFIQSFKGKLLYGSIPRGLLMSLSQNNNIPVSLRIKLVHLLVFYHLYKGYHSY
jgi:glycosyltransferase involved in cell wall biosynthesis